MLWSLLHTFPRALQALPLVSVVIRSQCAQIRHVKSPSKLSASHFSAAQCSNIRLPCMIDIPVSRLQQLGQAFCCADFKRGITRFQRLVLACNTANPHSRLVRSVSNPGGKVLFTATHDLAAVTCKARPVNALLELLTRLGFTYLHL